MTINPMTLEQAQKMFPIGAQVVYLVLDAPNRGTLAKIASGPRVRSNNKVAVQIEHGTDMLTSVNVNRLIKLI